MRLLSRRMLQLAAVVLAVTACDPSKPKLEQTLAQMQQLSAQQDSLLKDLSASSQFIADVSGQLSRVRSLNVGKPVRLPNGEMRNPESRAAVRTQVLHDVHLMTERLNLVETRLSASRGRVAMLVKADAVMAQRVAGYDSTITALRTIVEGQRSEIARLTEQVQSLTAEVSQLKADNGRLVVVSQTVTAERDNLAADHNAVYYVVGTKAALLKQHIIEQSGGAFGLWKVQLPARELNPGEFTQIDRQAVSDIQLPKTNTSYRIVSRQDLAALETQPDRNGRFTNSIKIRDPDAFWAASKYLIVIEQ